MATKATKHLLAIRRVKSKASSKKGIQQVRLWPSLRHEKHSAKHNCPQEPPLPEKGRLKTSGNEQTGGGHTNVSANNETQDVPRHFGQVRRHKMRTNFNPIPRVEPATDGFRRDTGGART